MGSTIGLRRREREGLNETGISFSYIVHMWSVLLLLLLPIADADAI